MTALITTKAQGVTGKVRQFAAWALLCFSLPLAAESVPSAPDFTIGGWREVVVSVSSLDKHLDFFTEVAGWETRHLGETDPAQLTAWQLPAEATAHEALVANIGTQTGFVRLIDIDGIPQQHIRSNSQSWDSGGILDINVRVVDMEKKFAELQARDWQAPNDPVRYEFGPFEVSEWVTRGPDGLAFALIQRHRPELEGWPHLKELSRAFNSTTVVADMEASRHFWMDILGFKKYIYSNAANETETRNLLGVPLNLTTTVNREVWVLHPEGVNEGSVELLKFHGLTGRDFSDRASPANIGIAMLRFPVQGITALYDHLVEYGVTPKGDISTAAMPPYGSVKRFVVTTPDGVWLEFFEE